MDRHRRVFTSQRLDLMRQMASQGCSAPEIAKAIGSTPASVRVVCSRYKIRLKRGRGQVVGHIEQIPERISLAPEHMVVAYMPAPLYFEFNRKAAHLDKPVSILASMLLNAIATSDIYKAVLDD
jgi:hypothetical protein